MPSSQIINISWEKFIKQNTQKFNLLYTDPPHGKKYKTGISGDKRWKKSKGKSNKFDRHIAGDEKQIDWGSFAPAMYELLVDDAFAFIHCDMPTLLALMQPMQDAGFVYLDYIIWDKGAAIGGNLNQTCKRTTEFIVYFAKGKPKLNPVKVMRQGKFQYRNRIENCADFKFKILKSEYINFPCQKPIALCKQVLELASKQGDSILDPFCGSGSAVIASEMTGRNLTALEIDKDVYTLACDRYNNHLADADIDEPIDARLIQIKQLYCS